MCGYMLEHNQLRQSIKSVETFFNKFYDKIYYTYFSRRLPRLCEWSTFSGSYKSVSSNTFRYPLRNIPIVHQNSNTDMMLVFSRGFGNSVRRTDSILVKSLFIQTYADFNFKPVSTKFKTINCHDLTQS